MLNVQDIANFFVYLSDQVDESFVTNLKLNKLLYYAQGCYLARTGEPLFDACIEAWPYGPVIPEIYQKYKPCGRRPIESIDDSFDPKSIAGDELEALLDVAREYGKYTGSALVTLTHAPGTPWRDVYDAGEKIITNDDIKKYFIENPIAEFSEDLEAINICPKEWYDASEDDEWEAYLD